MHFEITETAAAISPLNAGNASSMAIRNLLVRGKTLLFLMLCLSCVGGMWAQLMVSIGNGSPFILIIYLSAVFILTECLRFSRGVRTSFTQPFNNAPASLLLPMLLCFGIICAITLRLSAHLIDQYYPILKAFKAADAALEGEYTALQIVPSLTIFLLSIYYLASKLFSPRAGIIALLLSATHRYAIPVDVHAPALLVSSAAMCLAVGGLFSSFESRSYIKAMLAGIASCAALLLSTQQSTVIATLAALMLTHLIKGRSHRKTAVYIISIQIVLLILGALAQVIAGKILGASEAIPIAQSSFSFPLNMIWPKIYLLFLPPPSGAALNFPGSFFFGLGLLLCIVRLKRSLAVPLLCWLALALYEDGSRPYINYKSNSIFVSMLIIAAYGADLTLTALYKALPRALSAFRAAIIGVVCIGAVAFLVLESIFPTKSWLWRPAAGDMPQPIQEFAPIPEDILASDEPKEYQPTTKNIFSGFDESTDRERHLMGITVLFDGSIFAVDMANNRLEKFSTSGDLMLSIGGRGPGNAEFNEPRGVAHDNEQNIYVIDTWNSRVQKFSKEGKFLTAWGSPAGLFGAKGIAVHEDTKVYVTDTGNGRIEVFRTNGEHISTWGKKGSGPGEFLEPVGITTDNKGDVYVVDSGNNRVQKLSGDEGKQLKEWPVEGWHGDGLKEAYITSDGTSLYLASPDGQLVFKYSADGAVLAKIEGAFQAPTGIAVHSGTLYVGERFLHRVSREELPSR